MLIVDSNQDDSQDDSQKAADILSAVRVKSFFAWDGKEAIKKLEEFTPSLLVVDLTNPVSGGQELIEQFAASLNGWGEIPLVLYSDIPGDCESYNRLFCSCECA